MYLKKISKFNLENKTMQYEAEQKNNELKMNNIINEKKNDEERKNLKIKIMRKICSKENLNQWEIS